MSLLDESMGCIIFREFNLDRTDDDDDDMKNSDRF